MLLWTVGESNSSPLPCHGSALPNELTALFIRLFPLTLLPSINNYQKHIPLQDSKNPLFVKFTLNNMKNYHFSQHHIQSIPDYRKVPRETIQSLSTQ